MPSLFLSRLACCMLNLADKHGIILIPAYISTHLNVEADYLSMGQLVPKWYLLPCIAQAACHLWGHPEVDLLASSCTNQCQCYYTLESPLPLGVLGLNAFNHPWTYQVSFVFPPPALVPLVLSKPLVECVTAQFRFLILVAPCCIEALWLPTALNMLADVPHHGPIIKDLIMDVLISQMLKGLQSLHLILWLLRDMWWIDKGFLSHSVRQWWRVTLNIYDKSVPAMLERMDQMVCSRGCTKQCHFCP